MPRSSPISAPQWVKLALAVPIAASLAHSFWRHALLKGRTAFIGIELREKGAHAAVQTRDGAWHEARVLGATYVSPLLSVLNLRLHEHTFARHIQIVPDSADIDDFRRLRVLLRWGYRNNA